MIIYSRWKFQLLVFFVGLTITCVMLYIDVNDVTLNFFSEDQCACTRCISDTTQQDMWFAERYNMFVPTLLTRKNYELSPFTKYWWQSIQGGPKYNYSAVVENLFSLFPGKELYTDAGPHRCRTCAVVGNSGNLKESNYGPLIDSHDFVIRVNRGPTAGFEKDVGCKTTHRANYPESSVNLDNSTHLVFTPFKLLDLQWLLRAYIEGKHNIDTNKDKVMIMNPEFIRYVHETWLENRGKYPSTGFLMLVFSLHICDQVSVFGFGADTTGNWGHYYDKKYYQNLNAGPHRGSTEYNITAELYHKKKIQIYKGW